MKTMAARDSVSKLVCAIVGAALAAPAMAAPAPGADDSSLEEVIVTARKRDESFRDVPMTVNVFTEQAIAAAGIAKPGDFIARVPNMTLVETQNAGNAFVVVRGISQARNSEPSVAVLVDGPRGPAGVAKPGIAALARHSATPIQPLAFAARPALRLGSWDRTLVPLPFARVVCVFGEPIAPTALEDDGQDEVLAAAVSERLASLAREAAYGVGS